MQKGGTSVVMFWNAGMLDVKLGWIFECGVQLHRHNTRG
jgi:hypothetical protein